MNNLGIYIHIPFCKSKCYYCNFNSFDNMDCYIENYIDALCKEILYSADILSSYLIKSIYIGGGTPSYINEKYIVKILTLLKQCTLFADDIEITIELNPGTVNLEKLKIYKNTGINRISIGLQDTHDDILKNIGRVHKYNDYYKTILDLNDIGIKNYSTDLIYGLPGQTIESIKESLDQILDLNCPHISIYGLEVHENSKLDFLVKNNFLTLPDEEIDIDIKHTLESILTNNNYIRYEISNFAKEGFESIHNLNYWNQGIYLGFGAGASSYFASARYTNISDIKLYIDRIKKNEPIHTEIEEMDLLDTIKEYCILKLRLKSGINIKQFNIRFKKSIFDLFGNEINKLIDNNLLINDNTNIYLSENGKDLANIVWQEFI